MSSDKSDDLTDRIKKLTSSALWAKFESFNEDQKRIVFAGVSKHIKCCEKQGVMVQRNAIKEIIEMAENKQYAYDSNIDAINRYIPPKDRIGLSMPHRTTLMRARASHTFESPGSRIAHYVAASNQRFD